MHLHCEPWALAPGVKAEHTFSRMLDHYGIITITAKGEVPLLEYRNGGTPASRVGD